MKKQIWIPLILFILLAPFTPILDSLTSNFFYDPQTGFSDHPFFVWVYHWAVLPSWIIAIAGSICFAISYFRPVKSQFRHIAAVVSLSMLLGSGLLINATLKSYWGRPRPVQTKSYGGSLEYRPFYQPNFSQTLRGKERCRSFPSGHASTGFFFLTFVPLGWRFGNKKMVLTGWMLGFLLGGVLTVTRIAQGGHFFSDCLTSALLMWFVALGCDRFINIRST